MPEVADQQARDLIATATSQTLFVEAGAGTGKTTALVSRIVALIAEGIPIQAITAITFTEKAASELGERVRKRLEEAKEKDAAIAARFRVAVRDLDQAAIQTLHGFAMRILSLYPLEAGLPPAIRLRDSVEAALAFQERWRRFQDELLEDTALERPLLRGLTIGLRLRDLEDVAEQLNESWERLADAVLPQSPEPLLDPRHVFEPVDEASILRPPGQDDSLTRKIDGLSGYLDFLRDLAAQLASASAAERESLEVDLLRLLSRMPTITASTSGGRNNLGRAKEWGAAIEDARALMIEAEKARSQMLDGTRAAVICALLPRIRDFVLRGAEERRQRGELEFHDLLVLARNLLRDDTEVRHALHDRFQRILIDEFQDTDPLQIELAALLASRDDTAGPWQAADVEPGRLFFVGDPKQSIYRFRRADIELFKRARGAFASQHVPLTNNFRCRPGIIDWVNEVGSSLFNQFGAGPDSRQADWIPLDAGRDPAKGPTVQLIGGPRDAMAHEVRTDEAEAVVATILQARRDNWLRRDDPKRTETRFADIAILLPTRTNSGAIERALAHAEIPVRVESRSLLFAAQEIRDLTNILAAIDDPTDDVSVVAALRSPAFAVDDNDLLAHVNAGGHWDFTANQPETSPEPVLSGMASLRSFHAARWHASIGGLVERVIAERHMLELAIAGPRPRETWRRLRFVSEQARALGEAGTVASLRQFVHWLRTQASEGTRIAEAVANEPDDDAVRILTVHASKGLEFPIVILAGLGVPPNNLSPRLAWASTPEGADTLEVRTGRSSAYFETPGFETCRLTERQHGALERDRLFYVAATRARERLIVSLFHKAPSRATHEDRHRERTCAMAECIQALRPAHPNWETLQHGMALGVGTPAARGEDDSEGARELWISDRKDQFERYSTAPVAAATTIAHTPTDADDEEPEPAIDAPPWKKGRAGTSVGRAVHAVLQTIDLATGEGLRETANTQAVAEGIADEAARIAHLSESARTSPAVQAALASGRFWRELYVGARIEGVLVEGFIDLLYESPAGLVIVDYKTDSARDAAAIDSSMERYRIQGAAYALVLEQALGRPVAGCVFVFAEPHAERVVADLQAAMDDARAILRRRFSPAGR